MRILIDEAFRNSFPDHDCQTARYAGFAGLRNGELLLAAERAGFELLVTVDHGIRFQQNLTGRKLAVLILRPPSNRLKDLLVLVPACLDFLRTIRAGGIALVGGE
jgi:hypothetical protein